MLKLVLPKGYSFNANDFGTAIQFKIFNEDETAFDASTYNPLIHMIDENGNLVLNEITGSWSTQNQGIGTFAFTQTNRPGSVTAKHRDYSIQVQLSKSGEIQTTESKAIYILESSPSV